MILPDEPPVQDVPKIIQVWADKYLHLVADLCVYKCLTTIV